MRADEGGIEHRGEWRFYPQRSARGLLRWQLAS
jgi:hypothetical protein